MGNMRFLTEKNWLFFKRHYFGNKKRLLGFGSGGVSFIKVKKSFRPQHW